MGNPMVKGYTRPCPLSGWILRPRNSYTWKLTLGPISCLFLGFLHEKPTSLPMSWINQSSNWQKKCHLYTTDSPCLLGGLYETTLEWRLLSFGPRPRGLWGLPFLDHRGSPAREEPPEPPADRGPSDASNIFGERILYPSVWYIGGT